MTVKANNSQVNDKNDDGYTPLMLAAQKGNTERVAELLAQDGIEVNTQDDINNTALIFAAKNGHEKIVEPLLAADADVNAKNNHGSTALMRATRNNKTESIKLLEKVINANKELKTQHRMVMHSLQG